jgi:hypothetical protein
MSMAENPVYFHQRLQASGLVKNGAGVCGQIFCASESGATIEVLDDTTNSGAHIVVGPYTPVAGTAVPFKMVMERGIYIVITGTADISVEYT